MLFVQTMHLPSMTKDSFNFGNKAISHLRKRWDSSNFPRDGCSGMSCPFGSDVLGMRVRMSCPRNPNLFDEKGSHYCRLTSCRGMSRTADIVIAFHCRNSNIANNNRSFRSRKFRGEFLPQAKARMFHCITAGFLISHWERIDRVLQIHSQVRMP